MWRFGNLSKEDWIMIDDLLKKDDLVGLKKIHDSKNLSDYVYGCCDLEGLKKWFQWGMLRNTEK